MYLCWYALAYCGGKVSAMQYDLHDQMSRLVTGRGIKMECHQKDDICIEIDDRHHYMWCLLSFRNIFCSYYERGESV